MGEGFFEFRQRIARRVEVTASVEPVRIAGGKPLTVSQLTRQIDRALRDNLPATICVRGEVSNFSEHRASGHFYFTLKDADACIDCVMFKSDVARVKFDPKDGMDLLCIGSIKVYAQRGRYQFYVVRLEPLGQGALELAFQQLREKLAKEGFFERDRKKPLPAFPTRVALVTAPQGAALQDMLKVLRRFAWIQLFVYPVPVQGEGAAGKIAAALAHLNRRAGDVGGIDAIVLGRGGGSLEDLWAFNEEVVVRAMVQSRVPIVTGIGHEVDTSIADLVADHHAHTPTEAAQVLTQNWRGMNRYLEEMRERLDRSIRTHVDDARQRISHLCRHEFFRRPMDSVNARRQLLDDLERQLRSTLKSRIWDHRQALARIQEILAAHNPAVRIAQHSQRLDGAQQRLGYAAGVYVERKRSRLDSLERELRAISPQAVLRRGYSLTTLKKSGAVVRSAGQLKGGEILITRVSDGIFRSIAEDPQQPELFE